MDVHVHANCQAIPIAGMLREAYPEWNVTWFEAHGSEIIERFDEHCSRIRSADLVLSQPIHRGYRNREELSLDWVRQNVRSGATLLVFPSMHFAAHHLGLDGLPLQGLPFLSSLLAAHLVASGCDVEQTVSLLLGEDLLKDEEIETEIQASLDETKRREQEDKIDIWISPFMEANCRSRLMFHIQNHPLRETAAYIVNRVLQCLDLPRRVSNEGRDYQKETHVPPLPAVARFLRERGGSDCDPAGGMVLLPGYPTMTQTEYYGLIARCLVAFPAEEVFAVVAARWPTIQVLRRLAAQGSSIPGIDRWLPG